MGMFCGACVFCCHIYAEWLVLMWCMQTLILLSWHAAAT
jgi:hypothetical protein